VRPASRLACLLLAALVSGLAFADAPAAQAIFGRLAGEWRGTGDVSGMTGDMRMRWEPVLDGQFHRLTFENQLKGAGGEFWPFKAQAFYRVAKDGSVTGQWFDSRGLNLPLAGRAEADTLTIDWGDESSPERGRSTYRLVTGALEVTDEVYGKDGTLAVFGRTRLTRE